MVDLSALFNPHTCTVKRRAASGTDIVGQPTYSDTTVTTTQICRFEDQGTSERVGGIIIKLDNPRLFMPSSADIQEGDAISAIKRGSTTIASGPYEVIGIRRHEDGFSDDVEHVEVDLEAIS